MWGGESAQACHGAHAHAHTHTRHATLCHAIHAHMNTPTPHMNTPTSFRRDCTAELDTSASADDNSGASSWADFLGARAGIC